MADLDKDVVLVGAEENTVLVIEQEVQVVTVETPVEIQTTETQENVVIVAPDDNSVVTEDEVAHIIADEDETVVVADITAGPQGIPGPAGQDGINFKYPYPVAMSILAHRVVVLNDLKKVIYADTNDVTHAYKILGLSVSGANIGEDVMVQRGGEIIEPTWSWTPGLPIFLDALGLMTQTPPVSPALYSLIIGFALDTNKMFISIETPIILL